MLIVLCLVALGAHASLRAPVEPAYNATDAREAVYFAAAAYCPFDGVKAWDCGDPCKKHSDFKIVGATQSQAGWETNSTTYFGVNGDSEFVVAFEGTHNKFELAAEGILSWQEPYKPKHMEGVAVLDFFQDNWMETREAVVTALKEHFKPGMRVLVTGHSLGGAVAALCAFDLITSGYVTSDELYLYTFGEPRLGNHKFAYTFDDNVPNAWRLIHHDDLIPHIPLKDMLIDHYLHHSREIWYNEAFTNYTVCGPNEDDNCAEGLPFWDWKVSDHDWYFNYGLGHHTLCNW